MDQSAAKPVMDYNSPTNPVERRSPFTPRIVIFTLVVGIIIGWIGWITYDAMFKHIDSTSINGQEYFKVNLKAMSNFPFDQAMGTIEDVPKDYRALHGKKVILQGEIWAPGSSSYDLKQFDLVYSIAKCCFSGPQQIQHFVHTTSVKDTLPYYEGQVRVRGTLTINVTKDPDGKITGVYHLAAESVEPI